MNENQAIAAMVWAVWFSTALAVGAGLYFTHDMRCLWFMIIPALMSLKKTTKE